MWISKMKSTLIVLMVLGLALGQFNGEEALTEERCMDIKVNFGFGRISM